MLERFLDAFPLTGGTPGHASTLADRFGGCSFSHGLYRIHTAQSAAQADDWVAAAWPSYAGQVSCFGFDWLGRQFAADHRTPATDPQVLLLEPGTGQVLEIPVAFSRFHDVELVDGTEAALARSFFGAALEAGVRPPSFTECVGYRIPLFLGGADDVSNLEVTDTDVYWTLHGQLIRQLWETG